MYWAFLVLTSLAALPARGDDGKALAPFLDDRTVAVLRLDLRKLSLARLVEHVATKAALKPTEMAKDWSALVEGLVKDGADVAYVVVTLADVPDEYPFLVVPMRKDASAARLTTRLGELARIDATIGVSRMGETLIVGSAPVSRRLQKLKPAARPDVARALGAGAGAARLAVVPTTDARRILEETLPTLPDELGGGSIRPLSRGLQWLSLDAEGPPKLDVRLTVEADDADAAKALDALIEGVLGRLAKHKDVLAAMPDIARLAALWQAKIAHARLTVTLDEKTVIDVLRPYVEQLIVTERQTRAATQMRQLLAAMHAYEKKHGSFPAQASHDRKEKSLLSWRVHLLPFLGEEKLYKEFKQGEPWDSAHNKRLLARMPTAYNPANEQLVGQHRTTFLVPAGPATMFPPGRGVRVAEITDGTANTILLLDAADDRAAEWTRPADLEVTEKSTIPLRKVMGTRHGGQLLVGMADGSVRFLPATFANASLWGLFTRAGGEVVELP